MVLAGLWYAAYPVLKYRRENPALRAEVDQFIGLVRRLNEAEAHQEEAGEVERLKSAMQETLKRVVNEAGKKGDTPPAL